MRNKKPRTILLWTHVRRLKFKITASHLIPLGEAFWSAMRIASLSYVLQCCYKAALIAPHSFRYGTGEMVISTLKYKRISLAPARCAQARAGARGEAMDRAAGRASALSGYKKASLVSPPATLPSQSIHQKQPLQIQDRAPEGELLARRMIQRSATCAKFYPSL